MYHPHQIALGTVSNVDEGVRWLSYTYLYVRMHLNPLVYGLNYKMTEVGYASDQGPISQRSKIDLKGSGHCW